MKQLTVARLCGGVLCLVTVVVAAHILAPQLALGQSWQPFTKVQGCDGQWYWSSSAPTGSSYEIDSWYLQNSFGCGQYCLYTTADSKSSCTPVTFLSEQLEKHGDTYSKLVKYYGYEVTVPLPAGSATKTIPAGWDEAVTSDGQTSVSRINRNAEGFTLYRVESPSTKTVTGGRKNPTTKLCESLTNIPTGYAYKKQCVETSDLRFQRGVIDLARLKLQ